MLVAVGCGRVGIRGSGRISLAPGLSVISVIKEEGPNTRGVSWRANRVKNDLPGGWRVWIGNVGYGGADAVTNVGPVRVGSIDGCAPGYRRIGDPATMVIIR